MINPKILMFKTKTNLVCYKLIDLSMCFYKHPMIKSEKTSLKSRIRKTRKRQAKEDQQSSCYDTNNSIKKILKISNITYYVVYKQPTKMKM